VLLNLLKPMHHHSCVIVHHSDGFRRQSNQCAALYYSNGRDAGFGSGEVLGGVSLKVRVVFNGAEVCEGPKVPGAATCANKYCTVRTLELANTPFGKHSLWMETPQCVVLEVNAERALDLCTEPTSLFDRTRICLCTSEDFCVGNLIYFALMLVGPAATSLHRCCEGWSAVILKIRTIVSPVKGHRARRT